MTPRAPRDARRIADRLETWLEERADSPHGILRFLVRLGGFLIGSQSVAEAFIRADDEPLPDWLVDHRHEDGWYEFAKGVASASKSGSQAAVAALQEKVSGLQSLLTVAVPAAFAVSGASLSQISGQWGPVLFLLMLLGNTALVLALLITALASGLLLTLELSLTRLASDEQPLLPTAGSDELLTELRLREVRALHNAAWLAMRTSTRLGADLFTARRYAVLGTLLLASVLVIVWS